MFDAKPREGKVYIDYEFYNRFESIIDFINRLPSSRILLSLVSIVDENLTRILILAMYALKESVEIVRTAYESARITASATLQVEETVS